MPRKLCEKDPAGVRATLAEPTAGIRPSQDVDVLVVLDFQIPRFRPESPALYSRKLFTNQEGNGR